MPLNVFISYAREDQEHALKYYDLLAEEGAIPWIDIKHLLPGQNWETEIDRAFSSANVIFLLISKQSVNKRGFVQREANDAIERLRYKQPTDIYVIPLQLEACEVPNYISSRLQYIDINTAGSWEQVCSSLRLAAEQQSIELAKGANVGPFRMFTEIFEETWDGVPGHNIRVEYPKFESVKYPFIARELSQFFTGRAINTLIHSRQSPWDQSPDLYLESNTFTLKNERWDGFGIAHATERLISITYEVGWYGAGAAHPNSHFETYTFAIFDRIYLLRLEDFFSDENAALNRISELCIANLSREYWTRMGEVADDSQQQWFRNGAGLDWSNFKAFTIGPDRFTFLFAPYEVSAYALGRWSVDIYFYDLLDVLKQDGLYKLAIPLI